MFSAPAPIEDSDVYPPIFHIRLRGLEFLFLCHRLNLRHQYDTATIMPNTTIIVRLLYVCCTIQCGGLWPVLRSLKLRQRNPLFPPFFNSGGMLQEMEQDTTDKTEQTWRKPYEAALAEGNPVEVG